MRIRSNIFGSRNQLGQLVRDEHGGVMVEFAVVVTVFFFLFFTVVDIGRLAFSVVLAENAAGIAIRTAVVRPPACPGVPERHARGTATPTPRFGTSCKAVSGTCEAVATITCQGDAANPTALEIWNRVQNLLPANATIASLQFSYSFDSNLGFLGGPYTPMVSVDLNLPQFQFASPLGTLATAAGAASAGQLGANITYQNFGVSLPGEDLALGDSG
ncbi:TadE/TadG family type IV pilus assembly protein [Pseudohalocynthiibacter sp. F2068]|jgi:TadE-like protein|uniref:TadE/TadG family type IV pilus assembly protein n=1 Tax=Pseudohalocynthiibacter sp. F2068 TaxID=2926418 RepID=UPI001FF4613C|nr:TadE/TadG family type IV pilus assembly protein [Pseudohalocynthiibacter sp. F2068]MCK0104205.1 pilus assembly protein [Pseudohalocynthiibacter sp. F2068]